MKNFVKNQSGVTITTLVLYVASFMVIIGIITSITVFVNNNINLSKESIEQSADYNLFNLHIMKFVKNGYKLTDSQNNDKNCYMQFENNDKKVKFTLIDNILYFNKIKLCENIDKLDWKELKSENGKDVICISITINEKEYITNYVFE